MANREPARLVTLDTETTITDGSPSPFVADNRIVLMGDSSQTHGIRTISSVVPPDIKVNPLFRFILAGHHLAFDVLHLMRVSDEIREVVIKGWLLNKDFILWDTMIVDYLLSGSRYRSPSLAACCARRSIPFNKDTWATDAFNAGRGADELWKEDPHRLEKYLEDDLVATEALCRAQMRQLKTPEYAGLLSVVKAQMDALKYTILEQYYGLPIDGPQLSAGLVDARRTLFQDVAFCTDILPRLFPGIPDEIAGQFNIGSPQQVASVLYGGVLKADAKEQIGVYKTGQRAGEPKYKAMAVEHHVSGTLEAAQFPDRKTDDARLKELRNMFSSHTNYAAFINNLLGYRATKKLLGTYYEPTQRAVGTSFDGRLHGNINLAVTNTGRKSSSGPNLQNLPETIRALVKAPNGRKIVAADFKQIEIVAAAYLSQDPALMALVRSGRSIHDETLQHVQRRSPGLTIDRRHVKGVVFGGWLYGGGAPKIAKQSGLDVTLVREIQKSLKAQFPVATKYGELVMAELEKNKVPIQSADGHQQYESYFTLPTGRRLYYHTYAIKPRTYIPKVSKTLRGITHFPAVEFSYTQTKNRPVQAFATADIVPLFQQLVLEFFQSVPGALSTLKPLIDVHDELVFEVHGGSIATAKSWLQKLAGDLPNELNKRYQLSPPFDLPLTLEIGVGDTWLYAKP